MLSIQIQNFVETHPGLIPPEFIQALNLVTESTPSVFAPIDAMMIIIGIASGIRASEEKADSVIEFIRYFRTHLEALSNERHSSESSMQGDAALVASCQVLLINSDYQQTGLGSFLRLFAHEHLGFNERKLRILIMIAQTNALKTMLFNASLSKKGSQEDYKKFLAEVLVLNPGYFDEIARHQNALITELEKCFGPSYEETKRSESTAAAGSAHFDNPMFNFGAAAGNATSAHDEESNSFITGLRGLPASAPTTLEPEHPRAPSNIEIHEVSALPETDKSGDSNAFTELPPPPSSRGVAETKSEQLLFGQETVPFAKAAGPSDDDQVAKTLAELPKALADPIKQVIGDDSVFSPLEQSIIMNFANERYAKIRVLKQAQEGEVNWPAEDFSVSLTVLASLLQDHEGKSAKSQRIPLQNLWTAVSDGHAQGEDASTITIAGQLFSRLDSSIEPCKLRELLRLFKEFEIFKHQSSILANPLAAPLQAVVLHQLEKMLTQVQADNFQGAGPS